MASLIEQALSLEKTADEIVANAHAEAKAEEKKAEKEIEQMRAELQAEVGERIAAFRKEAQNRHEQHVAQAGQAAQEAAEAVEGIAEDAIQQQVARIVARFREW